MDNSSKKPVVLIIRDGWGETPKTRGNAILAAKTPRTDALMQQWPHTLIDASGEAVGLPAGQMGNSEVGHLAIGGGRICLQALPRQMQEIATGSFFENKVLVDLMTRTKAKNSSLHIMGLLSPGGVHSYDGTAFALIEMAKNYGIDKVYLHVFSDGRDVGPNSFGQYLEDVVMPKLKEIGAGEIVSLSGRYYAMDRDKRWERTEAAYNVLVGNSSETRPNVADYVAESYAEGVTDEFIKPMAILDSAGERVKIEDGDSLVFFNFRPDRAKQITHALVDDDFNEFNRPHKINNLDIVTMTKYDDDLNYPTVFVDEDKVNVLAEIVSRAGLKQFHTAETEKYAHVTYFLNGGREQPFAGEDWLLVPSPKVATYDLQPEMSAHEVRDKAVEAIGSGEYSLVVINFANADMVGHTGVFEAAVRAVEVLDDCVADIVDITTKQGGVALVTADHGNAEVMIGEAGEIITSHTTNPVLFMICGIQDISLRGGGGLSDIAPTILDLLKLDKPSEMTGQSLIVK